MDRSRAGGPQLPVELLDLIIRTYLVVKRLDVATVGALLETTSAMDILVADGSDYMCVEDLAAKLAAAGIPAPDIDAWRQAPAKRPIPPAAGAGEPWGLIFTAAERAAVARATTQVYQDAGLVRNTSREALLSPPQADAGTAGSDSPLGPDHVMHYEAAHGLAVVLSMRFELAPPGDNALASALSVGLRRPVYSFRHQGSAAELVAYREGLAARGVVGGFDHPRLPRLDLIELPLSGAERASLADLQHNLPALLRVLGIRSYGHQHANWEHFIDVHGGEEDVETMPLLAFTASPGATAL
jgi:hypothetical protein